MEELIQRGWETETKSLNGRLEDLDSEASEFFAISGGGSPSPVMGDEGSTHGGQASSIPVTRAWREVDFAVSKHGKAVGSNHKGGGHCNVCTSEAVLSGQQSRSGLGPRGGMGAGGLGFYKNGAFLGNLSSGLCKQACGLGGPRNVGSGSRAGVMGVCPYVDPC